MNKEDIHMASKGRSLLLQYSRCSAYMAGGPYAGFFEGGFEMERKITKNELSLQVHQLSRGGVWGPVKGPMS